MSDTSQQELDTVFDVASYELKRQRTLSTLLVGLRAQAHHHLVCHVRMGEVSSYLTSVTLGWVAQKVGFAADLPIFREVIEGSKRIAIDHGTVETIQQRQPDWQRQLPMAAYLATRKQHKFPPLLLVGYQRWVYDRNDEKWLPDPTGSEPIAMDDSLTLQNLEPRGLYANLDDSGTDFYALDGQHRLMAILGLRELIQTGRLDARDKERKVRRGKELTRDYIIQEIEKRSGEEQATIHERLQHLMDERIGVEIVPAVCREETYTDALRRLRQLFVDVNENARRLGKGELALLDETNGYNVVARRLLAGTNKLLCSEGTGGRVDTNSNNLSEKSQYYTTLKTLTEIVKRYLKHNRSLDGNDKYSSWDNLIAKGVSIRPEETDLVQGKKDMIDYFDHIATITSHIDLIQGKPAGELRSKDGEDNILFRPMAQTALAEALARLAARGRVTVANAVGELRRQESQGMLKLTPYSSPWFGVLSDPSSLQMRRKKGDEELCCRMFQYLLGGGIEDDMDREKLREDFAESRQIDRDNKTAIDLNGDKVETKDVLLPHPWL